MEFPVTLIDLAGTIALLLWGVHGANRHPARIWTQIGAVPHGRARNRFLAFLSGLGVTAFLQSSTATGLMLTGFAAGAPQLDLSRDIKRVNTHLVAAFAWRVLQSHGELLASRSRMED